MPFPMMEPFQGSRRDNATLMKKIWTTLPNGRIGMRGTFWLPALIALVAALGTAHILVRTSTYGASLDYAFNYLSAAESLAAGEGLLSPGVGQMVIFAPFFSMAMAFLSLFGLEPMDGGRFLNATAFGLLILASGLWLSRRLESRPIALGVAVAVMASLPLAHFASTLVSEPLFILFTLLALMPLESFLNRRSGAPALVLSAVFAALAALTRYIGVTLIISGVLMLLSRRNVPVRQRLKHALAFGAISSLPLAVAMARNQLASGTLFGVRTEAAGQGPSGQSLFDSLGQIVVVFHEWAGPLSPAHHWQLQLSPWLIAGLLLLLAALLLITPRPGRASFVFGVFALMYLAIIAVVAPLTVNPIIDSRFLTPVYVPLLFVAAFWLDALLRSKPSGRMSAVRWALVALALVGGSWHIGVSVQQNLRLTAEALESGYIGKSFNTTYWEDSELVAYVRANPVSGRYYSNDPNVLRWNAGVPGTLVSWVPVPRRNPGNMCRHWFERAVLKSRQYGEPEEHVVWVSGREPGQITCTLFDMEAPLPLEPVAELADGAIFRVNAAFDSAGARQSAWEALASGEPAVRSGFDVYLNENRLVYVREPCARADTEAMFFLHLIPADVVDLPDHRKQYGFDKLDFDFEERGVIFDGKCMAKVPIPEYAISEIRTGQFVPGQGQVWKEEFTPPAAPLNASVAKWLDNHAAAISITNDDWPTPGREPDIDSYVMEQGLVMGYEMVTGNTIHGDRIFSGPDDERIVYLMSELVPKGFGYFGHGHHHIDHDELSYEEALESFRTNYDTMKDWGMKPVAYAYPRSAGQEEETQRALEAAGFLSGRLQTANPGKFNNLPARIGRYFLHLARGSARPAGWYHLPGDQSAPDNWFGLRALAMQSIEFQGCEDCINDNDELVPILDEALTLTAWVILTYHAIGHPEWWGWYDWDEFRKDVQSIAARDFWTAPMNDITLYVRERENAVITVEPVEGSAGTESIEITLSDGLDNVRFNQPLTILFDQPTDWVGRPFTVSQDGELLDERVFDTAAVALSLKPNERPYVLRPCP